jgi:hypothetical protein
LNRSIYEGKITVKYETKLFTKKINGIILGDMTSPGTYPNPWHSEACYNVVLLNYDCKTYTFYITQYGKLQLSVKDLILRNKSKNT